MALPVVGSNLSFHNTSFLWEMFFRKLGLKPRTLTVKQPSRKFNQADDNGTNVSRVITICAKYSAGTAPATNTAADAPTGLGDICVYVAANNSGLAHIAVASIDIYRCSAFTDVNTFTWTKIVD